MSGSYKMTSSINELTNFFWVPFMGAVIGLGQLLGSNEVLTSRIILGRAISSAGIAVAAASILVWVPDLPPVALAGVAGLAASLGTSFLEKLVQKLMGLK